MRHVLTIAALVLLVAVCISGPLFEAFDHWDQFPQSGNDTLLTIVLVLTLFALCLCATLKFVRIVSSISRAAKADAAVTKIRNVFLPRPPQGTSSPPILCPALRI